MIQNTSNSNSQPTHSSPALPSSSYDDVINLLDYIEVITKNWRMIIKVMAGAFLISTIYSLQMTKIYSSTAKILPPQQDSGMMGMMSVLTGGMASLAGDILGKGSTADLYVGILDSETVKHAIVDRFKLMDVYKEDNLVDTYKSLEKKVDIAAGKKDGIISIVVEDKDPKRAADMANAYVEELCKLTVKLNITGAGEDRIFLEERLIKAKADLSRAEDNLKMFQVKHKLLDVTEQAKASIEGIALLRAQLAAQEVQFATLQRQFTESSQEVKTLKTSINNLRGQITRLEGGSIGGAIPNVGTVPQLGQESLRLIREFKVQETIFELLTKQYEMAKLTEAKNVAGVQIIQMAAVPDKKCKPKRGIIVLGSTFATGFGAMLYVLIIKSFQEMSLKSREQWNRIKNMLPTIPKILRR